MSIPIPHQAVLSSSKPTDRLRLSKYLAQVGIAARRKAEALIAAGRVSVNGKRVTQLPSFVNPATDQVTVDGRPVQPAGKTVLFAFYKPRGVLSTLATDEGSGLAPYLPKTTARLFPVGRLDQESEGLLLLTNDGQLALTLTHPRYEHPKKYRVWLTGPRERSTSDSLQALRQSRRIASRMRQFDGVELIGRDGQSLIVDITIHEGLKHFIRRLADAAGYTVVRLIRTKHGPYGLGDLRPGETLQLPIQFLDLDHDPDPGIGLFEDYSSLQNPRKRRRA